MITGFNTDIEYDGVVYHVQTEDKGLETPLILSLVYSGGAILASKRARYEDLIASGFSDEVLSERLMRQHKLICAAIHAGRLEDLKRMSGARVEAAAPVPSLPQTPELESAPDLELKPQVEPETELQPDPELEILRGDEEREALEAQQVAYNTERGQLASQEVAAQSEAAFDETADLTIEEKFPPPSEFVTAPLDENPLYSVHDQRRQSVMGDLPQASEGLRITLLGRHEFRSGQTINVKVMVGWRSDNQEKPVAKASVSVKVLGTAFRPLLYSAKTHSDGVAAIATRIPSFTSGRAAILIRAVFEGNETEFRRVIHPG